MDCSWVMNEPLPEEVKCAGDSHEVHVHALRTVCTLEDEALVFQALGSPHRLQLMERLLDGEHCVSQLAQELDQKATTISQRLQQLHRARLLTKERRGKHIHYAIADHHVRDLLTTTFDCGGHAADHVHGPGCGHEVVPHGDPVDDLVDGHLHHVHGDRCDANGPLSLVTS